MVLNIKRNDGFFDFFTNYYVYINNQKYSLAYKEELNIELPEGNYDVYSRYYWLTSQRRKLKLTNQNAKIEVKLFMNRQQWLMLLIIIALSISLILFDNEFLQDLGLFILKSWMVFYLFMLTIGSNRFMKLIFEEDDVEY